MRKLVFLFALTGMVALFQPCSAKKPSGFVTATDGGTWTSISIREDLSFEKAFNEVLDVCAKRFEMDLISKEGGYGRTNWIYTWGMKNGKAIKGYKTRVVFKFSPDRTKVDIKTEAVYGDITGFDTGLLQTMKQDIMGVIGRTTM